MEASHVLNNLVKILDKEQYFDTLHTESFIDQLVTAISQWKTSLNNEFGLHHLSNSLNVIDKLLPSELFDMKGGDGHLEELQDYPNRSISN